MLRADPDQLQAALEGQVREHHWFLLRLHLTQIEAIKSPKSAWTSDDSRRPATCDRGWAYVRTLMRVRASALHAGPTLSAVAENVLVQAAWAAIRRRDAYPDAQFQRRKAKRGSKKAIVAVAASRLTAVYFMLRDEVPYHDLGAHYFDGHGAARAAK